MKEYYCEGLLGEGFFRDAIKTVKKFYKYAAPIEALKGTWQKEMMKKTLKADRIKKHYNDETKRIFQMISKDKLSNDDQNFVWKEYFSPIMGEAYMVNLVADALEIIVELDKNQKKVDIQQFKDKFKEALDIIAKNLNASHPRKDYEEFGKHAAAEFFTAIKTIYNQKIKDAKDMSSLKDVFQEVED